jgi:Zn-dependent protease with chaperone function
VRRPGWGVARLASYALALSIHLSSVVLLAIGVWLIVTARNFITVLFAILALFLAFGLRPRLGSFRRLANVRYRDDAPVLFGVLDQVAAEVGAKPVHGVVANGEWNASYSAVGWRRKRVVTLGLPLWDVLSADQKVAVLGHEFAHGVNGDARHGAVVGTSLATLARLHSSLLPGPRLRPRPQMRTGTLDLLMQAGRALPRGVIRAVFTTEHLISRRAGQRAEYLADAIGARVASPASMADALDAIGTGRETYRNVMERRASRRSYPAGTGSGPAFLDELRSALQDIPENEKERRRRVNQHALRKADDTHPPTHLRIRMLRGLPPRGASVLLAAAQEDKIRAELAADYARIGG